MRALDTHIGDLVRSGPAHFGPDLWPSRLVIRRPIIKRHFIFFIEPTDFLL